MKNCFSSWRLSWITDQNILVIYNLQVTPMLSTKFQINWRFCSGEEAKNRFPIRTILPIFDPQNTLMLSIKFKVNWPFDSGDEPKKKIFKMAAILDFRSERL